MATAYPTRGFGSFLKGLSIQRRVLGALLLRELHSRYGRENVGYLWLIGEPPDPGGGHGAIPSQRRRDGVRQRHQAAAVHRGELYHVHHVPRDREPLGCIAERQRVAALPQVRIDLRHRVLAGTPRGGRYVHDVPRARDVPVEHGLGRLAQEMALATPRKG